MLTPEIIAELRRLDGSRRIALSNGSFAIVDDNDYDLVAKCFWSVTSGGYVSGSIKTNIGRRQIRIHRLITGAPPHMDVDHINGDKLDNRRSNLRVCTTSQNSANQGVRSNNTSGYKGVYRSDEGYWRAQITVRRVKLNLGTYRTKTEAARAYDAACLKHFGEYARPNFAPTTSKDGGK